MNVEQGGAPEAKRPRHDKRMRVYQQWQGNERFFFWGRLIAGPNWKSASGSVFLVVAPCIIFLIFVAPYMGQHVSWALFAISLLLPSLSVLWLGMTGCRDPGILPRQEPDEEWFAGRKARTREVIVYQKRTNNPHRVTVRYNDTCHFYQPPRAHHCSVNDNCIERFDHHCPWVGTTIGLRNYRTFLAFVYNTTILICWVFGNCLAYLFIKHNELSQQYQAQGQDTSDLWNTTLRDSGPALALMAYGFIFFWFVGGLSAFHCYLVATNQTTYENFRYNHNSQPNPYDEGCIANCVDVWCAPCHPSRVPFRAYTDEVPKTRLPEMQFAAYTPTDANGQQMAHPPQLPPPGGMGDYQANPMGPGPVYMESGLQPPQQQLQQQQQQPMGGGMGRQYQGGYYDDGGARYGDGGLPADAVQIEMQQQYNRQMGAPEQQYNRPGNYAVPEGAAAGQLRRWSGSSTNSGPIIHADSRAMRQLATYAGAGVPPAFAANGGGSSPNGVMPAAAPGQPQLQPRGYGPLGSGARRGGIGAADGYSGPSAPAVVMASPEVSDAGNGQSSYGSVSSDGGNSMATGGTSGGGSGTAHGGAPYVVSGASWREMRSRSSREHAGSSQEHEQQQQQQQQQAVRGPIRRNASG